MKNSLHRSMLILPIHVRQFVDKAHLRGADAVVLDLEDAVPPAEKQAARRFVEESVQLVGRGGADVLVRVNNDPGLITDDLQASVCPGVNGVFLPKVESANDVSRVGARLAELEAAKGMPAGGIKLSIHVESPAGLLKIQEIAAASPRIESMSLGMDDYRLELGVEPSEDGIEVLFPLSLMITVCKAHGISPLGILGSVARVRDLDGFERAAERARQLGCVGAFCVHPDQVAILNRVFSPSPRDVEHARRVVAAFEEGSKVGRAAVTLDGGMVDTPIYKRAQVVLERLEAVGEVERRKREALERLGNPN
ncbi:MAG: CoA ester lyase [Desulfomonile tiedjei]|nr:CoA ester lyase [Desulfomonile tiedjei]